MLSKSMQDALNKQLSEEWSSAHLYLSMSAYCESISYKGFANWLKIQYQEEMVHAMKMYDYLISQGARAYIPRLDAPETEFGSLHEIFKQTLAHEQHITACINRIYGQALDERDYATKIFLQWFVTEQIEEEANANDMLDKLNMAGDDRMSLVLFDKEAATRVLPPPTQNI